MKKSYFKYFLAFSLALSFTATQFSPVFAGKYNNSTLVASVNKSLEKKKETVVVEKPLIKDNFKTTSQGGITYLITSNNTLAVGDNTKSAKTIFAIPDTIKIGTNTYNVTEIGDNAFGPKVNSVTLGTNIKAVSSKAFNSATSLKSIKVSKNNSSFSSDGTILYNYKKTSVVKVPANCGITTFTADKNITDIESYAFYKNKTLKEFVSGQGVKNIGNYAFYDVKTLNKAELSISVVSIGDYAFANTSISLPSLPKLLTTLGKGAYMKTNITSATIPVSVSEIGDYTFYGCEKLTNITLNKKITSIGNFAFANSAIKKIALSDTILTIGNNAFENCEDLELITTGSKIVTIGDNAFENCSKIQFINIPSTVTKIGKDAFFNCDRLSEINVSAFNKTYHSTGGVLFTYSLDKLLFYPPAKTDPVFYVADNLIKIEETAFEGAKYLQEFAIENNNRYFSVIDGVLFDKSLNTLVNFPQAKSTDNYQIPYNVTKINNYAFANSSITNILNIPSTVSSIGQHAFEGCKDITAFSVDKLSPYYVTDKGVLYTKDMTKLVAYPVNSRLGEFSVPQSVKEILPGAFYATKLKTVTLNETLTTVGSYAFANSALTEITFPKNVSNVGEYALSNCKSLTNVKYTNATTSTTVGKNVYKNSNNLKSTTIPAGKSSLYTFM